MITKQGGFMAWHIEFYAGVEDDILTMPPGIQARILKLLELIEEYGANLGAPHTEPLGQGLYEIRAKAKDGIGRALFCYRKGQHIVVLHVFVKKTQKTPNKEINLAKLRMKEVNHND
jgi:phage-related protein